MESCLLIGRSGLWRLPVFLQEVDGRTERLEMKAGVVDAGCGGRDMMGLMPVLGRQMNPEPRFSTAAPFDTKEDQGIFFI